MGRVKMNQWNYSVVHRNGKIEEVEIFPYPFRSIIKYKIRPIQGH